MATILVCWYIIISQSVLWKILDCCVEDQGHSEDLNCQWMFAQMISSKPPNILFPNLVWWCIFMSRSVMQKDWLAMFMVKVTARAHMINWTADPFATKLGLMVHYHKPMCLMKKLENPQKSKTHLLRIQCAKVPSFTPGAGPYVAIHATPTVRYFFLISTLPVHSPALFPKPLPSFSCVSCG